MSGTSISKGNMHRKLEQIITLLTQIASQQADLLRAIKDIRTNDIDITFDPKPPNKGFNNDSRRPS